MMLLYSSLVTMFLFFDPANEVVGYKKLEISKFKWHSTLELCDALYRFTVISSHGLFVQRAKSHFDP